MDSIRALSDEEMSRLVINPYGNRGPVTNPTQFYGRRNDVLNVAKSIMLGQPFAMSGEPRIGKTSLLYYLVHQDGARTLPDFQTYIGNQSSYLFVLIELQRLPVRNAFGFWRYLLDRLIEEASKEDITSWPEQNPHNTLQESETDMYQVQTTFESYLKQLNRKVIFFFDDFDVLFNGFDNSEIVQVTDKLRTLKDALDLNEQLNYVVMSTDPLVRLFKANHIVSISPFISIIIPIPPLGLLEKDATNALIRKSLHNPMKQVVPSFTEHDIAFIYQLAGRYPDFMKITCYYLLAAYGQGSADYPLVRQRIIDDPHVRWSMSSIWERLKQDEQLEELPLREVLQQIAQGQEPTNMTAFRELRQRGLVEDTLSSPHIFGGLFAAFILNQKSSQTEASPVDLTPMELKLYNYLVKHIGETCSRSELQVAIWGNKLPNSPDALEQLVKRVRKKLETYGGQPMRLISVRGQGYFLRRESIKPL